MSSQRNAASFSRLKAILPAVPAADPQPNEAVANSLPSEPAAAPENQSPLTYPRGEERLLEPVSIPIASESPLLARSMLPAKPGKRKTLVKTATFRLPLELLEALMTVAYYNNLSQGDIVAESIFLHLENFAWPSDVEANKLREKLRLLF